MSMWGAFTNSTSAMIAQNSALNTISQNLANVNTNSYKRVDARFATMLSEAAGGGLDIFGVRNSQVAQIDASGPTTQTGNTYDVAIQGEGGGFFILNTQADGSGETLFTRDGSFQKKAIGGSTDAYLVDSNGYFVQGWQAAADGSLTATPSLGALTSVRVPTQMTVNGVASTVVSLQANLPAGATAPQVMGARMVDTSFLQKDLMMTWAPTGVNQWDVAFSVDGGTVTAPASLAVNFDGDAHLLSPAATTPVTIQWNDGTTQTLALDLSETTQFSGHLTIESRNDGAKLGELVSVHFTGRGELAGNFDNGRTTNLFKLPVARFQATNALETRGGNLYSATAEAGDMMVAEAGNTASGSVFVPGSVEASNVDIGEEFTKMIITQKAYSSAATVFRTADEMTVLLRDLKR